MTGKLRRIRGVTERRFVRGLTDGAGMFFRNNECLRSSIKIAGVAVKTTTPLPLREDAGGTITSELE